MKNSIEINNLKISERDQLLEFLRESYEDNPRQSNEEFWKWHFLETPYADIDKLPIWVAKCGEEIAGQLAGIPVKVNIKNEIKDALWILDFIVAPKFRRRGLGKRLVYAAEESCPLLLGVNTDEQHAPKLLQSLGFVIVKKIPRFHKLLFPANDIREISHLKFARDAINLVFTPFRPSLKTEENVRTLQEFDSSFNTLWDESKDQWGCAVNRDVKLLDWQYKNQPKKKFDIIGYFENEKLLGYAVLFFRKKNAAGVISKAAITDICYHPSNPKKIVEILLQGSLNLAISRRAGGLVTDVIDDLVEEKLSELGFWSVKNPLQLMVKSNEMQDLLYNDKSWFLTRGDSDISIFEDPNL